MIVVIINVSIQAKGQADWTIQDVLVELNVSFTLPVVGLQTHCSSFLPLKPQIGVFRRILIHNMLFRKMLVRLAVMLG